MANHCHIAHHTGIDSLLGVWSANLALRDYGRFARQPPAIGDCSTQINRVATTTRNAPHPWNSHRFKIGVFSEWDYRIHTTIFQCWCSTWNISIHTPCVTSGDSRKLVP